MGAGGMEKLQSLLFEEGRELGNIKFFPGTDRGLTADQLADEAASVMKAVFDGGCIDSPPASGQAKMKLSEGLLAK